MNLETVAGGVLLYLERYVDEGAKNYSPFAARTEVAPQYRPRSNEPSFDLITVQAPHDRVSVFQADPPKSLVDYYVRADVVRFVVHPETWDSEGEYLDEVHALPRGPSIQVAPTASTRTVLALEPAGGVPPHFIKLHYPRRISRFNRRLRRKNIHNSVAVTRDLAQVRSDGFAYLPDSLGFVFGDTDTSWGFLVRERMPRPWLRGRSLIPGFALYAGDFKHPDDPPLLVQLIERLGAEPASFVIDNIMIPLVQSWAKVARERGILLESHAQNVLLEIAPDFRPCRVVHRDFDVWIDSEVRRRNGLDAPFLGVTIGSDSGHSIEQHYSLVYDRFLGHEFFDYLLALLQRSYGVDVEAVRERVMAAFHRAFPEADRFFPKRTMFYFSNEPQPGNDFTLVDMEKVPEWR
ncbi:MAG: short-chain oxidoreductase [Planctomycetes bacterium]|nr:short-chain oxidoreductase [Planctomycetota bacterium]MBI3843210.1 short-chain oxidoreductase [Planctomycetota bacterium]